MPGALAVSVAGGEGALEASRGLQKPENQSLKPPTLLEPSPPRHIAVTFVMS